MKKNTIKFWLVNRFVLMGLLWIVITIILLEIDDKYLNAVNLFVMFWCSLGLWCSLIEDRNANASERLMWQKYSTFVDSCFEIC